MEASPPIVPVILSGGVGSRLWPLSRPPQPKQLLAMADTRTILAQDVVSAVQNEFGAGQRVFETTVKRSVRFAESAVAGQSILAYDPNGQGAEAYRQVAAEIAGDGVAGQIGREAAAHG